MAKPFCIESNISSCLKYLSGELEIFGYQSGIYEGDSDKHTLIKIINVFYSLISDFKCERIRGNEQLVEIANLRSQIRLHDLEKRGLEKLIDKEKSATLGVKELLNSTKQIKKELEKQLMDNKNEINVLKKSIEISNLHHGSEILIKDSKIANLTFKLSKFVNEEMLVEEPLQFSQFSQLLKSHPKLNKYICRLTSNVQMLIMENANIRTLVLKLFIKISGLVDIGRETDDLRNVTNNLISLPGNNLIEKLEQQFVLLLCKIRIHL